MGERDDGSTPPWIERRKVQEAVEVLENGAENWEYLDGEEKHGTVQQALHLLREVE